MAKVLVTGAQGYIGRALDARLRADGHEVVQGIRQPLAGAGVALDLERDPPLPANAMTGLEAVVHLAGLAHVEPGQEAAAERINVAGTRRLAEQALAAGVAHFVYVSSVQVHGRRDDGAPLTERRPYAPADGYARSKMRAEQALHALAGQGRMGITIVRPPTVYGPDAPGNLRRLVAWAARGRPFPTATRRVRRSLIARTNLCDLLARLITRGPSGRETFLVRDGTDLSVGGLYAALCRARNRSPLFVPVPPRVLEGVLRLSRRGGMADALLGELRIDDSHLRQNLAWTPPVALETGLAELALGQPLGGPCGYEAGSFPAAGCDRR